jgi:type VI protein secretion system component VasA
MNLRDRYEEELAGLWTHLARLGEKTERLAGLYAKGADQRVARLVQSAAFAFAVAENRLQDDGQALVRPLVARALPESLRPRPSSTIIEHRRGAGRSGSAKGTALTAQAAGERVQFTVMWPAAIAPIAIEDVVLDRLDARRQVLRFALVDTSGTSLCLSFPDVVRLFVHLEPRAVALDVIYALRTGGTGRMLWLDAKGNRLADRDLPDAVRWVRVDTEEPALVSARADRFGSGALLRDLFAMPESYCFVDVHLGGAARKPHAHRVEVTLPLAYVVEDAARLSLRLFCAPATNEFLGAIEPVADSPREASLRVAGKPHAEILEVRALWATSARDGGRRIPLRSWEAPDDPHTFDEDDVYFTLEQRLGVEDRTELRAMFGRLGAMPAAPGGVVEGEVLASDGALTAGLGLRDVGSAREGTTNITRVTPSRRAVLGENHAWRLSAYARMPAGRLARSAHLTELLRLHDLFGRQDQAVWIPRPTVLGASHEQEHELVGAALAWGDHYTLSLDPAGCTDGALWLVGELLHRALSERSEALRFARLSLFKRGTPFAEYAARQGVRLPFPLG